MGKTDSALRNGAGFPRRIHLIFKTHLDVGFTDLAKRVVKTYVDRFIPGAVAVARDLRERHGARRFIWTTGSWLIHHALETTTPRRRRELEAAIAAGDIVWHGLPFTVHAELMDAALFRAGLGIAKELDARFGRRTIAAKMTDVPCHTRAIVPLLAQAGIELLHIGVNPASTPPATPDAYRWQHTREDGKLSEITVVYEKADYGGLAQIANCPDALYFAHTGDNLGPSSVAEVDAIYTRLQNEFPNSIIQASTLDNFARVLRKARPTLPVVTQELGDTWIHGVGTDPKKVARFRALRAWRNGLNGMETKVATKSDRLALRDFDRRLLLIPEHTWGHDTKTCLGYLKDHDRRFATAEFQRARLEPPFLKLEKSWREQRAYLSDALAALRGTLFSSSARAALQSCKPRRIRHGENIEPGAGVQTPHFDLAFDPTTGAICRLVERTTGRQWADSRHPLGTITYEVFSHEDYQHFWKKYNRDHIKNEHWAIPDFLKPGVETAVKSHQAWQPSLRRLSAVTSASGELTVVADLAFEDGEPCELYGAPREFQIKTVVAADSPRIRFVVQWFGKQACRVPEATWFSVRPRLPQSGSWSLRKLGSWIDPRDVIRDGNRALHAVEACRYKTASGPALVVENPDAPLVAPGDRSLVRFTNRLPPRSGALHFNLHNNTWGTNFPLWYEDDASFRFVLTFDARPD